MENERELRAERCAFLIGQILGQLGQLLNEMKSNQSMRKVDVYQSLKDINNSSALHLHEIYYKNNKMGNN